MRAGLAYYWMVLFPTAEINRHSAQGPEPAVVATVTAPIAAIAVKPLPAPGAPAALTVSSSTAGWHVGCLRRESQKKAQGQ